MMTPLQKYRQDIVSNRQRLEIFIFDLIEEIGNADKAEKFLFDCFVPAFETALQEYREEEVDAMTTEKLRECPFCGGEAIIARETSRPAPELHKINSTEYAASPRPSVNDGWLAECKQCGSRGPHEYTMPVQSMDRATTAWNTRPESALEARVKELEAQLDHARAAVKELAEAIHEKFDCGDCILPSACQCELPTDDACALTIEKWSYEATEDPE